MVTLASLVDQSSILLLDGAMGTELLRAGDKSGTCLEMLNLTRPRRVLDIHRAYRAAGARVLLTNTFQANPLALARHGLEDRLEAICTAAVQMARTAAGRNAFVLASIGPIQASAGQMEEFTDMAVLARVLTALDQADGFVLETCSSPQAMRAVAYAVQRVDAIDNKPLILSLTYRRDAAGRLTTRSGHGPETFGRHAARHGVSVLGVNCGRDVTVADCARILHRYRQETDLPLLARPNAGVPPGLHSPQEMADGLGAILEAGAGLVGGCCGTTPEHIAAFAEVVTRWNARTS
jgi:5-methyltetrahydrofolate--homocysteine methyltransferase